MPIVTGPLPTVIYPKPREEQPAPQPQLNVEQQESQRFWTAQGYPQYAGRYKAVDLQGRQIESIAETPEGLNVTFVSPELGQHAVGVKPEPYPTSAFPSEPVASNLQQLVTYTRTLTPLQRLVISSRGVAEPTFLQRLVGYSKTYSEPTGLQNLVSYAQTPEGVQAAKEQELAQSVNIKLLLGEQLNLAELTYLALKGLDVAKEYVSWLDTQKASTQFTESVATRKPSTPYIGRWSELKDFGQDIANVKANAGTSSLTAIIEQYATNLYSKDIVTRTMQKIGYLPSQASSLMKVAGAVSTVESYINPNVPSLLELGSKSPDFIVGRLTGEAMLIAGATGLFSWVTRGTVNPLRGPVEKWLMTSYKEQLEAGVKIPSWTWKQSLVMKITGITPNLARGEVSFPIVETVSKTGVISEAMSKTGVPIGREFTDIGWELTQAPRMGGVMITKMPTATTPKALKLFFGIGEELIPFGAIKGEGEPLGFQKPKAEPVTIEKGLPPSVLEESYYPKIGGFDVSLKDVNVREVTSWPTTRSLMEEQKLLPFVTQTQVTRMGIFPYVPDMAVGETTKSLGSAFLVGLGTSLLPKPFSQTKQEQKATLPSLPKLEPLIKLKQPTFEEPFEIQKLKMGPSLIPVQKEKQRAVPLVTVGLGLESLTKAVSIQSPISEMEQEQVPALASALAFMQETKQVQSLAQIQKQIQSLTSQFKTPSLQRHAAPFQLPTEASLKRKGKKRAVKKRGEGLYLWEFPILDPEKVWKLK